MRLDAIPRAKAALERLVVVPAPETRRQLVEQARVAAAKDHVFRGHRGAQQLGAFEHGGAPAFFAERLQAALAEQVLERLVLERQVRELERHDAAIVDERGAEAGAEAEEQHAPALVAAERLHGGVVQDLDGLAKRRGPVEVHPALAEVPGLFDHLAAEHRAGNAEGDDVVVPVGGVGLDARDDLLRA